MDPNHSQLLAIPRDRTGEEGRRRPLPWEPGDSILCDFSLTSAPP